MDASRVIVCAPNDSMLFEISPKEMWACNEYGEINGQHYLEITTTRVLDKEQRIIVFDEREKAHEYVVASEDKEHANGSVPFGRYKCPWSLQHDACLWKVSRMVGTENPRSAAFALEAALSGTQRWTVGTVTLDKLAGASMYQMSGWEALTVLVETWGGEIDANVTVGLTGVTSRTVSLYAQMGEHTAKRRFDYARDVTSISRHIEQDPVACRIIPRGKGEKVNDGYGRKITIEDANDGVEWLQNDEAAELFKLPDGHGGWEYPVVYVDNQDIEDPAELKEWGLSVLNSYTTPNVSYTLNVIYLYREGINPYGVDLGDMVQVVDTTFGDTPLRIEARVVSMTVDRLDRSKSSVTVSNFGPQQSLVSSISNMNRRIETLTNESAGTTEYLNNLLENINAQINATGGWTYVTRGNGTVTYDRAVSDPLVGSEAHQVTEMKGGTLRFANSKTPQGEWNWTNVITADGYLGLAATIARLTTGFIGSADQGSYWDLDNHEFYIGGRTDQQINDGIDATITGSETQYISTTSRTDPPAQSAEGWSVNPPSWQRDRYVWHRTKTTYGNGTIRYSNPVCVSGVNGEGVTISQIEYGTSSSASATPTNWSTTQPQSITKGTWLWIRTTYSDSSTSVSKAYVGTDGTTVSKVEYGISNGSDTQPSSWSTTAPTSVDRGKWLWCKTTYSNNSVALNKSYVGTDGDDGTSVFVRSTSKSGKVTTVTFSDGTTMAISDGQDGTNGINGVNGVNGYVHVAWATSADGSQGFSTSDSSGKTYLGVYTDNTLADSTNYRDYSWSLIKGDTGAQGVGMSSISPQYYLSTSSASATGGNWLDTEPLWQAGRYIWQRYHIVWDDGDESYTDGFYAEALTDAASTAHHADEGAWAAVTDVAVRIEFAITKSNESAPDSISGTWSQTATIPKSDERLWKRDYVTIYHGSREAYEVRNVESVATYNANLTEVIGQYYLSTSASTATGGSWVNSCPAWSSGKTIWTRARTKVSNQYAYTTSKSCFVESESPAKDIAHGAYDRVQEMELGFHVYDNKIQYAIQDAARSATDYIQYENGELTLGATDSAVRNVMTNTRNAFRTSAGDIAYFGLDSDGLWRLFIENASITDMLRFGNFAWIARQNGNMTIKWIGA